MSERLVESEHRVTPLELFFDLVFVFGFTQVTTLLHEDPSWGGIGRSVLVLSALWWAWASYAWLTNSVDAEDGLVLGVMLVAIAAMFIGAHDGSSWRSVVTWVNPKTKTRSKNNSSGVTRCSDSTRSSLMPRR